ncbi:MAG: hypothetical protein H6538_07340 [Bacteroidales bacterium]|nr:hypothetical protein [Bacteroidales bacterium]MCB8999201.1 hypothetical protein [Bacteroidales bacterium]
MKIFSYILLSVILLGLASCNQQKDSAPSIDTDLSKVIKIQIFTDSGESADQVLDVSSASKYGDFKNATKGFELRKITYKVSNYNAPEDLFFDGTIICSNEENTESIIVGSIPKTSLSGIADNNTEYTIKDVPQEIEKVLAWLETPGRLKMKSGYRFLNADDSPYTINGLNAGSNFQLEIKFYVRALTKF